jgi:hypothetical protein
MSTVTDKPTVTEKPALHPNLILIAKQIKDEWSKLQALEKSTEEARKAFGKLLLDAKDKVGHGQFGKWIVENCDITWRTANRYMLLAQQPKLDSVSNLPAAEKGDDETDKVQSPAVNASDAYDKAEDRLVERLQRLSLTEAEAAVEQTVKKLRNTVSTMKQVLKNAA